MFGRLLPEQDFFRRGAPVLLLDVLEDLDGADVIAELDGFRTLAKFQLIGDAEVGGWQVRPVLRRNVNGAAGGLGGRPRFAAAAAAPVIYAGFFFLAFLGRVSSISGSGGSRMNSFSAASSASCS